MTILLWVAFLALFSGPLALPLFKEQERARARDLHGYEEFE